MSEYAFNEYGANKTNKAFSVSGQDEMENCENRNKNKESPHSENSNEIPVYISSYSISSILFYWRNLFSFFPCLFGRLLGHINKNV